MGQAMGGEFEKTFGTIEGVIDSPTAPPLWLEDADGLQLKLGNTTVLIYFQKIKIIFFLCDAIEN